MNLIAIEGLDGAGKSTQIKLLQEYFDKNNIASKHIHFPRTDAPFFGELVSKFLKGEFGKLEDVNPYLVAMIYAGDRKDTADAIRGWLKEGITVILDRYVYSNIAYQCAKVDVSADRDRLKEWILELEFTHFGIPKPDLNIFLDVPFSFTVSNLNGDRTGSDRNYLDGDSDIHEKNMKFQSSVREGYLDMAKMEKTLQVIDCSTSESNVLNPSEISARIIKLINEFGSA